jgi:uncharacterized protein (TIGR03083 family)
MTQTTKPVTRDYEALRIAEMVAISECLEQLTPQQWDAPSLCDGWRVRDVVSHMCVGYTTRMPVMLAKVARRGFNVPRASLVESIAFGSSHSGKEIAAIFKEIHTKNIRRGISKVIKAEEGLVDHLIHHQDIRRPLGLPRTIPADRLVAALELVPGLGGFVGAKKRVAGLRLVAEDVDWTHGDGPEVSGTGEAILLAASGRPVVLPELEGDGVDVVRARLAA